MSQWDKYLANGVPVPSGAEAPLRKELNDLSDEEMFLYLEGLKRFQSVDMEDPLSYYQIAGIHGRPYTTWPSWNNEIKRVAGPRDFGGFCTHTSILFLTWHRPYLALYESALYAHVNAVANDIDPNSAQKVKYQEIAKSFRIPYWDWARRNVPPFPLAALTDDTNPKNFYKSNGFKEPQLMEGSSVRSNYNPLFAYKFADQAPDDVKTIVFEEYDKQKKQWFEVGRRKYKFTQRYANLQGDSTPHVVFQKLRKHYYDEQEKKLTDPNVIPRNIERNLSERVAYVLKAYQRFGPMCYNQYPAKDKEAAKVEVWGSLEDIHNSVHNFLGGDGHMSGTEISAFDPVFWLHHANIDRLFAIWQALHESDNPESYVTEAPAPKTTFAVAKGQKEEANTPLYPFRRSPQKDGWWTSKMTKRTETFGYAYPEIAGWQYPGSTDQRSKLTRALNKYYSNLPDFINKSMRKIDTAGASLLPQAALLRKLQDTAATPNIASMQRLDAELPNPEELLQISLEPGMPFLRDIAKDNSYLEWLVNIKAEKHALDGGLQVHVFLGDVVEEDSASLWPFSPNHVGTFVTLGQKPTTECEKCQQDQADGVQVTGQVPLTLALAERYLAQIIESLDETTVVPYLQKNLHWRVAKTASGYFPERDAVNGLKVLVTSNKVTVSENPDVLPIYEPGVKVYPEITTKVDGTGRGSGTGVTAAEIDPAFYVAAD